MLSRRDSLERVSRWFAFVIELAEAFMFFLSERRLVMHKETDITILPVCRPFSLKEKVRSGQL